MIISHGRHTAQRDPRTCWAARAGPQTSPGGRRERSLAAGDPVWRKLRLDAEHWNATGIAGVSEDALLTDCKTRNHAEGARRLLGSRRMGAEGASFAMSVHAAWISVCGPGSMPPSPSS